MSQPRHLIHSLAAFLEQGADLLASLDAATYRRSPAPLATAPVGGHVRHCLDFVCAFLRGWRDGEVDYDRRERDPRLEEDPAVAGELLRAFSAELLTLVPELDPARELRVRAEAPPDAGPEEGWLPSTLGRELSVLSSHTVHHYALIAMTLRHFGRDVGPEFGVAPSTLHFWKEEGAKQEAASCAPAAG